MSLTKEVNAAVERLADWYVEELYRLVDTMDDGAPVFSVAKPKRQDHEELRRRTSADWRARAQEVGFARMNEEYLRMMQLDKEFAE